jgi:hypothetical protein
MNILEDFKKDKRVWDDRYNLPLVPEHNNPNIYFAYAYHLIFPTPIKEDDHSEVYCDLKTNYYKFLDQCEKELGLYYRWPDKSGGAFSWDEIIGVASISPYRAYVLYQYLKKNWGVYDNGELPEKKWRFFRFNQYRYPFLMPYLKARSGLGLNCKDKAILSLFLWHDRMQYKYADEGGRLRIWLMNFEIEKHIPNSVYEWKKEMSLRGLSPKRCFEIYFPNYEVFSKYAPYTFLK